ncbi:MAG: tetratricopeptide repeat protein [Candidatus Coatesbacteria bacterium]|nr:tetratricopeptide repeat protein [Candidatus Coatesbacteria bacterium]
MPIHTVDLRESISHLGFARSVSILALVMLLIPAIAHARAEIDPKVTLELYNDGCDSYEKGDFAGARDRFLAAALVKWKNPDLFYNLGNSYFRTGDLGRAILYYERAKELAPRDDSITYNLHLAQSRIIDRIEPVEHNILAQLFIDIYSLFNPNEWSTISLSLYVTFMALAIAVILLRGEGDDPESSRSKRRKLLMRIAGATLVLLLFSLTNTAIKIRSYNSLDDGIVVADAVKARSGPGEKFAEVFELHSGSKVRVQTITDGWYQISLESGLSGWLPGDSLEIISGAYGLEEA